MTMFYYTVKKKRYGFEVTMDYAHVVDLLDGENQVGEVELSVGLLKVALFLQQMPQIAPIGILQNKKMEILISK